MLIAPTLHAEAIVCFNGGRQCERKHVYYWSLNNILKQYATFMEKRKNLNEISCLRLFSFLYISFPLRTILSVGGPPRPGAPERDEHTSRDTNGVYECRYTGARGATVLERTCRWPEVA